jgi:uncharacterized protein (DUF2141 family)
LVTSATTIATAGKATAGDPTNPLRGIGDRRPLIKDHAMNLLYRVFPTEAITSDDDDAITVATTTIPGRALAHHLRNKSAAQRAAMAAMDTRGDLTIKNPTIGQIANLYGISRPTLNKARGLSPEECLRVMRGERPLDTSQDRLQAAIDEIRSDADVVQLVVKIGAERTMNALDVITAPTMMEAAE